MQESYNIINSISILAYSYSWFLYQTFGLGNFTEYEQAIFPDRGSAAFWMDLDSKGHRDMRSSHMGCPVLKGSKWILNKWIYQVSQGQKENSIYANGASIAHKPW